MSTRSSISHFQPDGSIKQIYCHSDGYLKGVGGCLLSFFNSEEKAAELMALGDLSGFNNDGEVSAFHRDRGEDWEDVAPHKYTTFVDWRVDGDWQSFDYAFKDGTWFLYFPKIKKFKKLTENLIAGGEEEFITF